MINWCIVALTTALAMAQAPDWQQLSNGHGLRVLVGDELSASAVVVAMPNAHCADPGEERVLAQAMSLLRDRRVLAVLPVGAEVGSEVLDGVTLHQLLLPNGLPPSLVATWFDTLLAATKLPSDADALALALARAALNADDEEALLPGRVLQSRARRELAFATAGGCSRGGAPRAAQQYAVEDFAKLFALPLVAPVRAVVIGSMPVADILRAALLRTVPVPVDRGYVRGAAVVEYTINERTKGAFIAAAFRAPMPAPANLPFALAIEVLRFRAQATFGTYRYLEMQAGAPFVDYAFLSAEPVVMMHRRGKDFGAPDGPRNELAALLARIAAEPVLAVEVANAAKKLQREWAVPPYAPQVLLSFRQNPVGLLPRARALLLLGCHGITDAMVNSLGESSPEQAQEAITTAISGGVLWLTLLSAAKSPQLVPSR